MTCSHITLPLSLRAFTFFTFKTVLILYGDAQNAE